MSEFENGTLSPWGYTIDSERLPNFINKQDFNLFTNYKFGDDTRIDKNIPSATAAIRDYCGWHISPSLECGVMFNVRDLRDAFVGCDLLVQLPATFVSKVSKVLLNATFDPSAGDYSGDEVTDFDLDPSGLLRVYDVSGLNRKSKIFIHYTAGYPDDAIEVIKELTAHRVVHAVSSSYGVMSEAAGGVSVTYNASWAGNTRSTALADDNREVLDKFKAKGVF